MSACYSVCLKMYVNDEKSLIKTLKTYAEQGGDGHTNFLLDRFAEEGVYPDTLDGLMKIYLAGWKSTDFRQSVEGDGMLIYANDFNASYGWEVVMQEMFDLMIPYISDISTLTIEPDNDGYILGIKNGKSVVLQEWEIGEDEDDEDA